MKFRYLIFSLFCCLFTFNVSAISNVGVFSDLTIGDIGNFSSLDGLNVINNKGYSLIKNDSFYYALPSSPNYTLGKFGGNLTQCGLSFTSENYYSVTYYFILNDLSNYVHPYYTSQKPLLGISSTVSNIFYNFDFSSVSSGIEILTLPEPTIFGEYLGLFTIIFKAPAEGTCLNLAYSSSSKNASVNEVVFVGYKYNFLGSKPLTEVQIQNALNQNFVDLENKINNMTNAQNQTNQKLDDVVNTNKGILATIKDVLSNIINLPKKIVEFLIEGLKTLFVPTEEQLFEIVNDSKKLSENFGFVGESVAFFLDIFTSLLGLVNSNGCIELPAFKIGATSLFNAHTFWEAQQVCLADNAILSANIVTIRTITSIVFVCFFVGFAYRKFHTILSKNDGEVNSE